MPGRREPPRPLPSSNPRGWPTTRPPTPSSGRSRRKSLRKATAVNSEAAAAATAGTAPVGAVAPGVAAKIMGVATPTTAAGVAAAVVEVRLARRVMVVAQDAANEASRTEPTGVMAAALGEAPEGIGTSNEVVQRGMTRPPPPARVRARARTTAR